MAQEIRKILHRQNKQLPNKFNVLFLSYNSLIKGTGYYTIRSKTMRSILWNLFSRKSKYIFVHSGIPNLISSFIYFLFFLISSNHLKHAQLIPSNSKLRIGIGDKKFIANNLRETISFLTHWGQKTKYEHYFEVKKDNNVIDIGANIGYTTISYAKIVDEKGLVVAIEADPENEKLFRANIRESHLDNVKITEKGVWNHKGSLTFYHRGFSPIDYSFIYSAAEKIEVQVDTLDSITSELGIKKIDYMKMNIEGAELEALKGTDEVLSICEKIVVTAEHVRDGKKTAWRVCDYLKTHGFKVFVDRRNDFAYGSKRKSYSRKRDG